MRLQNLPSYFIKLNSLNSTDEAVQWSSYKVQLRRGTDLPSSTAFRPPLGPTYTPIPKTTGSFAWGKHSKTRNWRLMSTWCQDYEWWLAGTAGCFHLQGIINLWLCRRLEHLPSLSKGDTQRSLWDSISGSVYSLQFGAFGWTSAFKSSKGSKWHKSENEFQRIITALINRVQSIRLGLLDKPTYKEVGDLHQLAQVTVA